MGYYRRADLPVHNALADAFTLCDNYFSSVMGPTGPNRLMWMSGSIGGGGLSARPMIGHLDELPPAALRWRTFPENLTEAGVGWKVYNALAPRQRSELTSTLKYFAAYSDAGGELHARGLAPRWPHEFLDDVRNDRLPAVSWIIPSMAGSEHPNHPPPLGAETIMTVLWALLANPALWERTAVIVSYDENGGYFDHVAPPVPPAGATDDIVRGEPVGLGFRVPCLVLSPFSRGGMIRSEVFDHTSQLRLLSRRFGVPVPNVSTWRRATVGDLDAALRRSRPDPSPPRLPSRAATTADATLAEAALRVERREPDR
jgi:phospholipase C